MNRLWVRTGDAGDYEDFDNPYDAGVAISVHYDSFDEMPKITRRRYGVSIDPFFTGYNYVSLFWGDADAQPVKDLTATDITHFKAGIADGADIKVAPKAKRSSTKRRSGKRSSSPTSIRGIR